MGCAPAKMVHWHLSRMQLAAETFDPLGVSADSIGTIFFADNLTQTVKM